MKIFISGPMNGLPLCNLPAFYKTEEKLRQMGFQYVQNPARNPRQTSWAGYMKDALRQLIDCDTVVVLPGWGNSRGSREEVSLAHKLDMKVMTFETIIEREVC